MARFPAHLRHAGAKANTRTGLHIHIGAADFTPENIKNLVRTFYKQEELILKAAGTESNRIARYTRKTDHAFVDKICRLRRGCKASAYRPLCVVRGRKSVGCHNSSEP